MRDRDKAEEFAGTVQWGVVYQFETTGLIICKG